MPDTIKPRMGERMEEIDVQLLQAIHKVEKKVVGLEMKIDDSVNGRFKDNERRIEALESNQRWVILGVIGAILTALMKLIVK